MPQLHEIEQMGTEGRRLEVPPGEDAPAGLTALLYVKWDGKCKSKGNTPVFFGNRLCPYAHRAWWALAEKGVEIDYVHVDLGQHKPAWYQKHVNPFGTVPCLYLDGEGVFESTIICEFIEDAWKAQQDKGKGKTGGGGGGLGELMPADPFDRAAIRLLVSQFNEKTIPPFYRCLKAQTPADIALAREVVLVEMVALESRYAAHAPQGPFFLGGEERFSLAEIMVFPFIERMHVALKHYRGLDILADAAVPRLRAAMAAVRRRPAHRATTQPAEFYVQVYDHYANPVPTTPAAAQAECAGHPSEPCSPGKRRALGWRVAAFLKAPAAVPVLAVPVLVSAAAFLLGCGLGYGAAKGPNRFGGHLKIKI